MESRSRRYLKSPKLLVTGAAILGLSILSGYARNPDCNCNAFIDRTQALRESGDNAGGARWAAFGERQCRAEGNKQFWRLNLLKAESLTDAGEYTSALRVLDSSPLPGSSFALLRARRLNDQAWIHFLLTEYDAAERLVNEADQEAHRASPPRISAMADVLTTRLYLYGKTGNLEAARHTFDLLKETGQVDPAHLLGTYGTLLDRSGRFEEAASYFEAALLQPGLNALETGKFQNNLAEIYYHLGNPDQALAAGIKAEPALRKASDRSGLRVCLNTLGLVHMDLGEMEQAEETLDESRQLAADLGDTRAIAEVANNLTLLAIKRGDWTEAAERNRQAFEIEHSLKDVESEQYSHIHAARIYAGRKQFAEALAALGAIDDSRLDNPNPRIDAEVEFIAIYRQLGDQPRARAHYRSAQKLIATVRSRMDKDENKLAWYDSQSALNQEWVRFLMQTGHTGEALESAEASRVLLMRERLGNRGKVAGRLSDYRVIAKKQDAALVSYWLMPDVSYAWVVNNGTVQFAKLHGEHAIASLVGQYRAFIEDGNDPLATQSPAADQLRRAILDPVLPLLAGAKRVIVVPDAQLHALNLETLTVNGHYWIQDVALTIAPSLNVLVAAAEAGPKVPLGQAILAVGDPTPTADFPKLPNASRELDAVTRVFHASNVLRGPQATPAAYFAARAGPRYIHFAAHAAAFAEQPLDSAIILSAGRLTARDLLHMPIHAELVTLSSCSSAGTRSYHGEGLVGLAWVFLQTGAHGVIAGLWNANDDATATLMSALYQRIASGLPPGDALRQAKLAMIAGGNSFARPYYWGPFQYYRGADR